MVGRSIFSTPCAIIRNSVYELEVHPCPLWLLSSLFILMHKGKGGGLSDMFGGGLTQNAGSSGVAEKNLNRWTVIIALLWVAIIIALGLMTKFNLI